MKVRLTSILLLYSFFLVAVMSYNDLNAQPVNDECLAAIDLPRQKEYCSAPGEFTNVGATAFGPVETRCFATLENDVWFTFVPTSPAVIIRVNGNIDNLGTMTGPGVFVFEGPCRELEFVSCNTVSAQGASIELTVSNLVLGQVYYLAVVGAQPGTFQLCLDQFTPPPTPEQDCDKAVILCDKSPFYVENITGIGDPLFNEVAGTCIFQESASVWYKWTCEQSGTLTFTLTPNDWVEGFESDDLDFVLFELEGGLDDCNPGNRTVLRCMASGANTLNGQVLPLSEWRLCNGPTGLREGETDVVEEAGCEGISNNFVAPAVLEAGKSYALVVNNFSESGLGFSIEFGGTATFLGPEPDFVIEAVEAFACDKTIVFTNESFSDSDPIVGWQWSFGSGAAPESINGAGPHSVVYESFGDKVAALTVESSRGCRVTRIIDLFVDPCCADTTTLAASAIAADEICPGASDGKIEVFGFGGAPEYEYSIDSAMYQPSPYFNAVPPDDYTIFVRDIKGCVAVTGAFVGPAPPFSVEAGDTLTVQLGQTVQLEAVPEPPDVASVSWSPSGSLEFSGDSLQPVATAPGTTSYAVSVTNSIGCVASDTVLVLVDVVRPVFIPDVFSPNGDGVNDWFFISGGPAVANVEVLRIFDRWGALVYESNGIAVGSEQSGWDGKYGNGNLAPGVFTYHARIRFIDNVELDYSGTVTVVR